MNADCVVRYLLNYPGLIGGEKDEKYGNCDLIFSYSELIKESLVKFESEIMFMPVCDTICGCLKMVIKFPLFFKS